MTGYWFIPVYHSVVICFFYSTLSNTTFIENSICTFFIFNQRCLQVTIKTSNVISLFFDCFSSPSWIKRERSYYKVSLEFLFLLFQEERQRNQRHNNCLYIWICHKQISLKLFLKKLKYRQFETFMFDF